MLKLLLWAMTTRSRRSLLLMFLHQLRASALVGREERLGFEMAGVSERERAYLITQGAGK